MLYRSTLVASIASRLRASNRIRAFDRALDEVAGDLIEAIGNDATHDAKRDAETLKTIGFWLSLGSGEYYDMYSKRIKDFNWIRFSRRWNALSRVEQTELCQRAAMALNFQAK